MRQLVGFLLAFLCSANAQSPEPVISVDDAIRSVAIRYGLAKERDRLRRQFNTDRYCVVVLGPVVDEQVTLLSPSAPLVRRMAETGLEVDAFPKCRDKPVLYFAGKVRTIAPLVADIEVGTMSGQPHPVPAQGLYLLLRGKGDEWRVDDEKVSAWFVDSARPSPSVEPSQEHHR